MTLLIIQNSGGTTLTIIGNNLNSSASPYLQVILNTTTSGRFNKNITVINGVSYFLPAHIIWRYSTSIIYIIYIYYIYIYLMYIYYMYNVYIYIFIHSFRPFL